MSQVPKRARRGEFWAWMGLTIVLVLPGVILWRWSDPRVALPTEMPPLALDGRSVAAQIGADEAAAAAEPTGAIAERRRELYQDANEAELRRRDSPMQAAHRRAQLREATQSLLETAGEEGVRAAQAADLALLEPGLRGRADPAENMRRVGGFPEIMRTYGLTQNGIQVAPQFVVRTAFKARWNAMHERPLTEGFSEIELRAHYGWLGLRASGAPLDLRLSALEHYAEAGGESALEARAVLYYEAGRLEDAAQAFEAAYQQESVLGLKSSFRLRNYALAAAP